MTSLPPDFINRSLQMLAGKVQLLQERISYLSETIDHMRSHSASLESNIAQLRQKIVELELERNRYRALYSEQKFGGELLDDRQLPKKVRVR